LAATPHVTVQPLWELYAEHFSRPDASPDGPAPAEIAAVVARVGQEALEIGEDHLRFAQPGMGVTLNGVGQGYITDRVVELLRAAGVEHALVDMVSAAI
jgi:thiamine biosynthesis lipoprotein